MFKRANHLLALFEAASATAIAKEIKALQKYHLDEAARWCMASASTTWNKICVSRFASFTAS